MANKLVVMLSYYWLYYCCTVQLDSDLFVGSELTQIVGDVIADPTLPRTADHPCPKCDHKEAVFFQSQAGRADVSITLLNSILGIKY